MKDITFEVTLLRMILRTLIKEGVSVYYVEEVVKEELSEAVSEHVLGPYGRKKRKA